MIELVGAKSIQLLTRFPARDMIQHLANNTISDVELKLSVLIP